METTARLFRLFLMKPPLQLMFCTTFWLQTRTSNNTANCLKSVGELGWQQRQLRSAPVAGERLLIL